MTRPAVLIVAFALLLNACTGDDGTADYLDDVAATLLLLETDTFAALPRGAEPTRTAIGGVIDARGRALDVLQSLTPPQRLSVEHDALVITLRALLNESRRFLEQTADLDDEAFTEALSATAGLDALAEAVGRACRSLTERGASLGFDADLRC